MKDQKVFVIGFHKTGLTSLGRALEILGYRVCHRAKPIREALGHDEMIKLLENGSYTKLFDIAAQYNAFHDNPWFWLYKELDKEFPNSKFILSLREEQSWLQSAQRYFGESTSDFRRLVYGNGQFKGNENLYLERHRAHVEEVRTWFKGRNKDLLELDIIAAPNWALLCKFLDKDIPNEAFPHLNTSSKPSSVFNKVKNKIWKG